MLIKRRIEEELREHLSKPEITMVVGPRQAGKTTLLKSLRDELVGQGEKTVWFNLDFEEDDQFFVNQRTLIARIRYLIGDKGYVFIDEIQRKSNAGLFLKGLYDRETEYKWVVTGSGSLELKEKVAESLAGRKQVFELSTLSLQELVDYREEYREGTENLWNIYPEQLGEYLDEYRQFGGYPRVVIEPTIEGKRRIIAEIYESYLEKDLRQLLRVEKSESLKKLTTLLASQVGQMVNYCELSATLGVAVATVKKYLWYMTKTFMLYEVTPYFANKRKEITKAPIYYFSDVGMCNYASGMFGRNGEFGATGEAGFLAQNLVFNQLKYLVKNTGTTLHYWRTIDGAEVDFVMNKGPELIPYEVKDQVLKRQEVSRSYRSFIAKYHPATAVIVSKSELPSMVIDGTKVEFWSFGRLMSG